jgi:hypothetical protein
MGWAIVGLAAVLGTGLLFLLFRSGDGGRTRLGSDGFFVRGEAGRRVRYRVCVNGTWREGVAELTGGETFVYTGATPTEVQILGADAISAPMPSSSSSVPSSNDDQSSGFAGFPSAY